MQGMPGMPAYENGYSQVQRNDWMNLFNCTKRKSAKSELLFAKLEALYSVFQKMENVDHATKRVYPLSQKVRLKV
jgi:hypothetical protein